MRNWLIKKLGGYTELEYKEKQSQLRQLAGSTFWCIVFQREKVYGHVKSFYKAAGLNEELATLAAQNVKDGVDTKTLTGLV